MKIPKLEKLENSYVGNAAMLLHTVKTCMKPLFKKHKDSQSILPPWYLFLPHYIFFYFLA